MVKCYKKVAFEKKNFLCAAQVCKSLHRRLWREKQFSKLVKDFIFSHLLHILDVLRFSALLEASYNMQCIFLVFAHFNFCV